MRVRDKEMFDFESFEKELRKCADSFDYFCQHYVYIVDKRGRKRLLKLNAAQKQVVNDLHTEPDKAYYVLKSRKLGVTTGVLAYAFWYAMFHRNFRYAFIAATAAQAVEIFEKAAFISNNLPEVFKAPGLAQKVYKDSIEFENGAKLHCVSERQTDSLRGGDLHFVHFSEFAFYEKGPEAITAIIGALPDGAIQVYETTAKGLGFAHDQWFRNNGWNKRFFPVWNDPDASVDQYSCDINTPSKGDTESLLQLRQLCEAYRDEWKLTKPQYNFFLKKFDQFGRDLRRWHQEFPASAELAFSSARGRVFLTRYEDSSDFEGEVRFSEPRHGRMYSMGVDAASGSETGDFTAWAVLDVTDEEGQPEIVCTGYFRVTPDVAAEMIGPTATAYNASVVVEKTGHGEEIIRRLREDYPEMDLYREQRMGVVGGGPTERIGFTTGARSRTVLIGLLHDMFGNSNRQVRIHVPCQRLRMEINNFEYNDKGKAEHAPGQHDDLLFAAALARYGSLGKARMQIKPAPPPPIADPVRRAMFKRKYGYEAPLPQSEDEEQVPAIYPADYGGIASIRELADSRR